MKKLIAISLLIALLLSGCSAAAPAQTQPSGGAEVTTQPQQEDKNLFEQIADGVEDVFSSEKKALTELGDGVREESSYILYITINPEFELFLDMDAYITKVRCINEDAEGLFAQTNVLGMSYDEGIPMILDAACDQGYLNEQNSEITIETTVQLEIPEEYLEDSLEGVSSVFEAVVTNYAAENELSITVDMPEPVYEGASVRAEEPVTEVAAHNSEETYDITINGVEGTRTEYYDENGILYKKTSELVDGTTELYEYNASGVEVYYKWDGPDGLLEYHKDENGNLLNAIDRRYDEGYDVETIYYPVGDDLGKNMSSQIRSDSDGYYCETYYREDGTRISSYSVGTDGTVYEEKYYENDQVQYYFIDDASGHKEQHYLEDGTLCKYVEESGNGSFEETYYPNGQSATSVATRSDSYSERRWSESGRLSYAYYKSPTEEFLFEDYVMVYYIDEEGIKTTDRAQLDQIATAMGLYN